jgi:hypothetical protein
VVQSTAALNDLILDDRRRLHGFGNAVREQFQELNLKLEQLRDLFTITVRSQMSYTFCDCTVKLTSPYRLACSSTGEGRTSSQHGNPAIVHVRMLDCTFCHCLWHTYQQCQDHEIYILSECEWGRYTCVIAVPYFTEEPHKFNATVDDCIAKLLRSLNPRWSGALMGLRIRFGSDLAQRTSVPRKNGLFGCLVHILKLLRQRQRRLVRTGSMVPGHTGTGRTERLVLRCVEDTDQNAALV